MRSDHKLIIFVAYACLAEMLILGSIARREQSLNQHTTAYAMEVSDETGPQSYPTEEGEVPNSPSPEPVGESVAPKAGDTLSTDTVEGYIRYKFGDHTDKAMELLTGEGCAENRQLDQKAVNDNRTWGGVGRDVGIFQINDYYHPVEELNLEHDFKANIDYAWRMYVNDNYTFSKRWTCGKYKKSMGVDI